MDLKARLNNLLSRKFLTPLISVVLVILKDSFLPNVPVQEFINMILVLGGLAIGTEGAKDITNAYKQVNSLKKK